MNYKMLHSTNIFRRVLIYERNVPSNRTIWKYFYACIDDATAFYMNGKYVHCSVIK